MKGRVLPVFRRRREARLLLDCYLSILLNVMKEIINTKDRMEVAFFVLSGFCGITLILFVVFLVAGLAAMHSEQEISGPVTLSTDWIEIIPDKPIKPAKQHQEIVLDVNPAEGLVRDNLNLERMQLASGEIVKPEIQLIEQHGETFVAEVDRYPVPSRYEEGLSGQIPNLPEDKIYTKLRVRCDKPLRLSRIVWHCWDSK